MNICLLKTESYVRTSSGRVPLTNPQRATLAEIGKRLGRQGLEPVAGAAKPDTILGWYRKLIARKFDGSKHRTYPGRPPVGRKIAELVRPTDIVSMKGAKLSALDRRD